jgi:hypothetical protein
MPFYQNFSVLQTPANPALLLVEDTSTTSPATNPTNYAAYGIAARRIYIQDYNGDYIVPAGTTTNYIPWALLDNPITLNVLTQDMAVNIRVDWVDSFGVVVNNYTKNNNYCLTEYNKQFLYYLIQLQSLTYNIIQDNNYWGNVGIFWTNVIGAINCVQIADDITASQVCLNRATYMATNQSAFF